MKLFGKFERGAAIQRDEAEGFGLGLNFVKNIAEAHGGIVKVFSTVKEGSEFTIILPI
jgi:two-component system phosphate regulon sensor histidine kinase PhoR